MAWPCLPDLCADAVVPATGGVLRPTTPRVSLKSGCRLPSKDVLRHVEEQKGQSFVLFYFAFKMFMCVYFFELVIHIHGSKLE